MDPVWSKVKAKFTPVFMVKDELPPITTFLNRLLALTIELQGVLFTAFEQLLTAKIEGAIAAGIYDVGLETLTAEGFTVTGRQTIYTHPGTGAETRLLTIAQRTRNLPVTLDDALAHLGGQFTCEGRIPLLDLVGSCHPWLPEFSSFSPGRPSAHKLPDSTFT